MINHNRGQKAADRRQEFLGNFSRWVEIVRQTEYMLRNERDLHIKLKLADSLDAMYAYLERTAQEMQDAVQNQSMAIQDDIENGEIYSDVNTTNDDPHYEGGGI